MRYYSTQRPVTPGSYPKNGAIYIENYSQPNFFHEINRAAWGFIDYDRELTAEEAAQWELTPDGMKTWYGVVSTFDNRGRVTAAVTRIVQAVERPEREYKSTIRKDIYLDWFDTREEADHFVAESKKA